MLSIAICDDAKEDRDKSCQLIKEYFKEQDREVDVSVFEEAEALLSAGRDYDLYLLDVIMPDMSGMQAAERLLKRRRRPVIVFITSSLESAVDGYRVNAAGFLLKPIEESNFRETLTRVEAQYLAPEEPAIEVLHNRVPVTLPLKRIAYLESRLHQVSVVLDDGEMLTVHQKLQELQEKLESLDGQSRFLRCHQSYLINLSQVSRMEADCFVTLNGRQIPISRNNYKQSKHMYYHYLLK